MKEIAALRPVGFTPLGPASGTSVVEASAPRPTCGRNRDGFEVDPGTAAGTPRPSLSGERQRRVQQAEAAALEAEGIVGVQLLQHGHSWSSHVTEFFAVGTAVRPVRDDHTVPQLVLGLDS